MSSLLCTPGVISILHRQHQLRALAAAGLYAVVPDMPGDGQTDHQEHGRAILLQYPREPRPDLLNEALIRHTSVPADMLSSFLIRAPPGVEDGAVDIMKVARDKGAQSSDFVGGFEEVRHHDRHHAGGGG